MTDAEIAELITRALFDVAPDLEGESIVPDENFMEQFEIDSMDFLNFVIGLHEATGVDIPESDYPQLATLSGSLSYLRDRLKS